MIDNGESFSYSAFLVIFYKINMFIQNGTSLLLMYFRIDVKPHVNYIKQSLGHTNPVSL
jgi:hypothetical protein